MAINPYLQQNANSIATNLTTNLNRNILPQFRRGAVASGGWGNSGTGIAQGIAAGDTSRAIADAQGNMYLGAYEGDQNRSNQMGIASMQTQAQRDIANMNDATNRYGYDQTYKLGQERIGADKYIANQDYSLGQQRIGQDKYNTDQTYKLGQDRIVADKYTTDKTYGLGQDRITADKYISDQDYDIGLYNNYNNAVRNNNDYYTNNRELDLTGQQQGFDQLLRSIGAQTGVGSAMTDIGNEQYDAIAKAIKDYGGGINPFTGINNSDSTTSPSTGGGAAGAVGGAMTGAAFWNMLQKMIGGG